MNVLSKYQFESNALYVSEKLGRAGIKSIVLEDLESEKPSFQIKVYASDYETAKEFISKLKVDETDLDSESEGYLDGHDEWNTKMYDPGHYTGGKVPHYLYNKDVWKYIAPIYISCGIGLITLVLSTNSNIDVETVLWIGLYFFVGISMLVQLKKRKKR